GPHTYSDTRGHPRLRMRHAPFVIGPVERDAWLRCMKVAVDAEEMSDEHRKQLWAYLDMAANRCRYHWPSGTRVHAGPPNWLGQLLGGAEPSKPPPSRKT
ncbi:hypothetical protein K7G98_35975, partial [Saccharothrix sp. MB29]|nr:hypothetical protein [Saccharothrix sp. MB29]